MLHKKTLRDIANALMLRDVLTQSAARPPKNEVLTDERLDYLAERFRSLKVRELTWASFAMYLRDPGHYDALVANITRGGSLTGKVTSPRGVFFFHERPPRTAQEIQ